MSGTPTGTAPGTERCGAPNCARAAEGSAVHGRFCCEACSQRAWAALPRQTQLALAAAAPSEALGAEAQSGAEANDGEDALVRVSYVNLTNVSLSKEEMGRAGWTFLHATAEALPKGELSAAQRASIVAFTYALGVVYPCELCREHFARKLVARPPRVETGEAYCAWLCETHNDVNRDLGKPVLECGCTPRIACEP